MKRIFTLLLSVFLGHMAMAQSPEAVVKKTDTAPTIDGVIDAIWGNAPANNIVVPFKDEAATVGNEGETTWKALWNADGMYFLIQVADENWFPNWAPGGGTNDYEYDKIELYFDTNLPRLDAVGGHSDTPGSIQIAPGFADGKLDGQILEGTAFGLAFNYAFKLSDPTYVAEYFIPWDIVNDNTTTAFDKMTSMGFDVTIVDRDQGDAARKRINWANAGAVDESWANMDDAGVISFEGAVEVVEIEKITVSGGTTITTDGGTLQMSATIEPEDATSQKPKWVVENNTGEASITKEGLVTAIKDGTVLVKAMATDGSYVEGKVTITITGQTFNKEDIWNSFNKITNWHFENGQTGQFPVSWGGWIDKPVTMNVGGVDVPSGLTEQGDPVIVEGVCVMKAGLAADNAAWHYQLNQSPLSCEPNVPYTLKFKTWATADATPCVVDFESNAAAATGEQYKRYGASTDPEALGGRGEWNYMANIEPRWVEFHVTFDQITEGVTIQKIQWMFSLSNETISMDSLLLIKDSDILLKVPTLSTAASKVQLYPNPAQNELTVSQIAVANSKVSVYNAVGQKLMEKTATGNQAKFDVANLRKGMYFVRFSDGSSQKFIKE
jgi:hypothetical protein